MCLRPLSGCDIRTPSLSSSLTAGEGRTTQRPELLPLSHSVLLSPGHQSCWHHPSAPVHLRTCSWPQSFCWCQGGLEFGCVFVVVEHFSCSCLDADLHESQSILVIVWKLLPSACRNVCTCLARTPGNVCLLSAWLASPCQSDK